jgi:hypothetical protein
MRNLEKRERERERERGKILGCERKTETSSKLGSVRISTDHQLLLG